MLAQTSILLRHILPAKQSVLTLSPAVLHTQASRLYCKYGRAAGTLTGRQVE